MEWQQHTERALLTALVCTTLSAGTAWAAVPQVSTVDVQQLSQAQGLVVDSDDTKRKPVEQESTDAQGHVRMGIADAGSQAAKSMQQSSTVSAHEQAWDIMSMPMRWQSVEQAERDQEAAAQGQVGSSAAAAAGTVKTKAVPSVQVATPAPAKRRVTAKGPQQIVQVPPANGAVKPIIITARDIEQKQRRELLKPQSEPMAPHKPAAQAAPASQPALAGKQGGAAAAQSAAPAQHQAIAGSQPTVPTPPPAQGTAQPPNMAAGQSSVSAKATQALASGAVDAVASHNAATTATADAAAAGQSEHRLNRQWAPGSQAASQAAAQAAAAPTARAGQAPIEAAEQAKASVGQQANAAQAATAGETLMRAQQPAHAPANEVAAAAAVPTLPPEPAVDAMERPEPFRNVSETTWRHIQAGILATQMMLSTECSEHGMYLLAQMLNHNTGLTHLAKIDYLIGIGYAINHSPLLNDWQKNAFLDAFMQFCE